MLYQNPIFYKRAFHRELSQAALNAFINAIAELVQTVTDIECLLYADDLVPWYSSPKKNAQERSESALNDQPMSFHTMKALIRRKFQTSRSNELKAQTKERQWTVTLSDIPDWPRIEAVAEFRLHTEHECLAKHLHRLGVYAQPACPLCNLHDEMEKTHLIRCPALKTRTESQRYWKARRQLMNCY
ncbi:unnamed protein product [Rodentolepis nana]|uniref:Zf-RVT domain-containing protein n=1 Tax=Rodentolepis nana TaxID=102285 RepID=A0A0R3TFF2_RODNA|nr:unnamed protein product [Rodentolepis nana]